MESALRDLRHAVRGLLKQRSFSAIVVVTLALAIGVNTLVFCLVDLVAFRPLPFEDIDGVASMWMGHADRGDERVPVSAADYVDWRRQATSFEDLAARTYTSYNLTGVEVPTRLRAVRATASLFRVWGLGAVRGRPFRDAEDRPGAPRVAAVSHGFWERELGADPEVVGRSLRLDGESWEIVGVLDPKIEIGGLSEIDVWTPLMQDLDPGDREERILRVDGRLASGVPLEQAAAEMRALVARLADEHPSTNAGFGVRVMPLRESVMGQGLHLIMALLAVTVAFVLAIACANVASLMLSRTAARARDTALRAALGAGRTRLVRGLLTEGAVLALVGGVLGVGLAAAGVRLIQATTYEPAFQQIGIEGRVLSFSLVLSLLTPVLFGLAPALQAARTDIAVTLRDGGGRSGGASSGGRLRRGLVVAQLALALMLLVVAGLSVRTAVEMRTRNLGFEPGGVAFAQVELPAAAYPDDARSRLFFHTLLESVAAQPGIEAAGAGTSLPVTDFQASTPLEVEGAAAPAQGVSPWAAATVVTRGYLETLRIPLTRGRGFEAVDAADSLPVALVSEAFAARHFAGRDPLGRRIRLGAAGEERVWRTIVGVTGDLQNPNFSEPPLPQVWVPFAQQPGRRLTLVLRAASPVEALAQLRAEVTRLDPDQVIWNARSFDEQLARDLNWIQLVTSMFSVFGLAALLLAAIGLYGVISYAVGQRTREIGVRIALGAASRDVLAMVLRQAATLVAAGLGIGVLGGLSLGRLMSSLLVGITGSDPTTFVAVGGVLGAVALVATLVPAHRASRLDPMRALRAD